MNSLTPKQLWFHLQLTAIFLSLFTTIKATSADEATKQEAVGLLEACILNTKSLYPVDVQIQTVITDYYNDEATLSQSESYRLRIDLEGELAMRAGESRLASNYRLDETAPVAIEPKYNAVIVDGNVRRIIRNGSVSENRYVGFKDAMHDTNSISPVGFWSVAHFPQQLNYIDWFAETKFHLLHPDSDVQLINNGNQTTTVSCRFYTEPNSKSSFEKYVWRIDTKHYQVLAWHASRSKDSTTRKVWQQEIDYSNSQELLPLLITSQVGVARQVDGVWEVGKRYIGTEIKAVESKDNDWKKTSSSISSVADIIEFYKQPSL
ncbi:hypothetical protein RISK_005473 [Rhodopirellula islandica]|uniref:Signal peptide and transmembrane protein n=1 Tax=Rhodopirellula islandica TaxID=595434 RepID=A0A0J1B6R8_RHOIS|nr:hypothetical protein [Rhodopirellula islandica]KLU02407.1 hypothetical protein RISK_005473 [Rhodopirellula islandica]